jgi:hypothetical protein
MKKHTGKRQGLGLEVKTVTSSKSSTTYLVYESTGGSNTCEVWKSVWDSN